MFCPQLSKTVAMANTSSRTLRLLSLLQDRRFWPGPELADRLEVSARTLRRDVDRLRELGYPVDARPGVDGGYVLAAGAVLPPLVLDDDEAVALGVGLQAAIQGGTITGIEESAVRALAKIVQVMPSRLRRRVDAVTAMTVPGEWGGPAPSVEPDVLAKVAQAGRDRERLEFAYTARDGAASERRVDPHRLVLLGRRWYLVAWDLERVDWRIFRLDRVEHARSTGAQFAPRPLPVGDAAEFVRTSITEAPTTHRVEVVIAAPAATVRARIGRWGTLEALEDDRCLLLLATDSLDWPILLLGQAAADFEVKSPPALAARVRDWGERFGRSSGHAGPPG